MRRFAIAMVFFASFMLTIRGLSQDNASSSTPPAATVSQDSGKETAPPDQQNSEPVLTVCGPKNQEPCADGPPRMIEHPVPEYSKEAREKRIQGTVVLSLVVGSDGLPRDIRVVQYLGYGLDGEAVKAVEKWTFEPATMHGKPVAVRINVQVEFRLRDDSSSGGGFFRRVTAPGSRVRFNEGSGTLDRRRWSSERDQCRGASLRNATVPKARNVKARHGSAGND